MNNDPLGFGGFMAPNMPSQPSAQQPARPKKGFLVDNISTVGGIIGGLGGGALGALAGGFGAVPGAGIGAAAGSGFGETLENILMGEDWHKNVAKEAAIGGVFGAGPLKLLKMGAGGATALSSGGRAAGGLAKGFAAEAGEEAGEQALKTSMAGRMTSQGNRLLASQYGTIREPTARAVGDPLGVIGKLAEYGITKPMDAERVSRAITGSNGLLTKQVAKAVGAAGNVNTSGVMGKLNATIKDQGLIGRDAKEVTEIVSSKLGAIEGNNASPSKAIEIMRKLESQIADYSGRGGNYKNADPRRLEKARALQSARDEIQDQLYNAAGANKNLSNVLTQEVREQLLSLRPKSNEWARFVNQNIMKSKTIGDLRSAQAPFVNMTKIIDDADLGAMTFRGRVGDAANAMKTGGGLINLGTQTAIGLTKNPASRITGSTLRDVGSGAALNQSAKGMKGLATNLGGVGLLARSMTPGGGMGTDVSAVTDDQEGSQATDLATTLTQAQSGISSGTGLGNGMGNFGGGQAPTDGSGMAGGMMNAPQQTGSPYSRDALIYDMQRDPANAEQYIAYYEKLSEIFNSPADEGPKLNATQIQQANTAISGMQSLQDIAGIIDENPNAPRSGSLPGGSFMRNLTGTGEYSAAVQNAVDAIGRLRSGGAINADEEARFREFLPGAFDDQDTIRYKLGTLNNIFARFANPQPATDLAGALMQQQSGGLF